MGDSRIYLFDEAGEWVHWVDLDDISWGELDEHLNRTYMNSWEAASAAIKIESRDPKLMSILSGLDVNKHGELLCDHTWLPIPTCSHCQGLPWEPEDVE